MKIKLAAFCLVVLLPGCSTLNKNECLNADWSMIGFEDASHGLALERIGKHRKACAKVNVVPDMSAYEKGHKKGARQYCTPQRGYTEGVNGGRYQGICPSDLASAFTRAYQDGQELYSIKQLLNSTVKALAGYRDRVTQLEVEVADLEKSIVDSASSSTLRRDNLQKIKERRQEITNLEIDSAKAEQELRVLEDDYQSLLIQHKEWGY